MLYRGHVNQGFFLTLLCFESRQYEEKVKVENYNALSTWYDLFSIYDCFKKNPTVNMPTVNTQTSRLHYCVYNKTYF